MLEPCLSMAEYCLELIVLVECYDVSVGLVLCVAAKPRI